MGQHKKHKYGQGIVRWRRGRKAIARCAIFVDTRIPTPKGGEEYVNYTLGLKLEPYKNVKIVQFCSWHGKLDDTFTSVCHLSSLDLEKLNK